MKTNQGNVFTPNIMVVGVGGAGTNSVNNLMSMDISGVTFMVANTDVKSLEASGCENKLRLGPEITKGLGAGSQPIIGYKAAEESTDEIRESLRDIDLLFMVVGMGGGTGTGASQVIAKIAKDMGILTLGFVTTPFAFEGNQRMEYAREGIEQLYKHIDSLVIIANQNLFKVVGEATSMIESFRIMDNVIYSGVKAISDLIVANGMVNLDFNDIKTVIRGGGTSMVTSVEVEGKDQVSKITDIIINNPLIDDNIDLLLAKNILINISGGSSMSLFDIDRIVNGLRNQASPDTYINFGAIFDEKAGDLIRVSVIATGISDRPHHSKVENHRYTGSYNFSGPNDTIKPYTRKSGIDSNDVVTAISKTEQTGSVFISSVDDGIIEKAPQRESETTINLSENLYQEGRDAHRVMAGGSLFDIIGSKSGESSKNDDPIILDNEEDNYVINDEPLEKNDNKRIKDKEVFFELPSFLKKKRTN